MYPVADEQVGVTRQEPLPTFYAALIEVGNPALRLTYDYVDRSH
jgi:hypothetical protein